MRAIPRPIVWITIDDRIVPLDLVHDLVAERLATNDRLVVVVERDSEYGPVVEILDELRLARATQISLKAMRVSER